MNLGPTKISGTYLYVLNQSGANPITLGNGGTVDWNNGGVVALSGPQTIAGSKTFSSIIVGDIDGNAGRVTNGVYTTGDQNISGSKNFTLTPTVNNVGVYLNSNPSGFITGINLSAYVTTGQTGAFYAASNPSGFITGVNLSPYATIEYVTGISGSLRNEITTLDNQTGGYALKSNTGQFLTTGAADNRYFIVNDSSSIIATSIFI